MSVDLAGVRPFPGMPVVEIALLLDYDIEYPGEQDPRLPPEALGKDLADTPQRVLLVERALNDGDDLGQGLAVRVEMIGDGRDDLVPAAERGPDAASPQDAEVLVELSLEGRPGCMGT